MRLPERGSALGARKPRATLELSSSEEDGAAATEKVSIPVAVARALDAADGPEPQSRAEVLFRVRESADACAWARVVDMVSRREHSSQEVQGKLVDEGYTKACAERVVRRAQDARIVSDRRFSDSFVRSKLSAGWGPIRIERELKQKGIDPEDIPGWPEEYLGEEAPEDRALELLGRKRIPEKNAFPKLVRFLVSKGYSISTAKDAVSSYLEEHA